MIAVNGEGVNMDERNDINKFRKKTMQRKMIFRFALVVLLALTIILVAVNWGKIIAPLKDAALDIGEGGYPVELPGSTSYMLEELGENYCLLTDTYLYTYNPDGANIISVQHGYQNPAVDANDKRVLVYDRSGKGVKFFSKSAEIYSKSMEDTIVFAEIGKDDRCAVVTTSVRYSNYLYVLNAEGDTIFRWASPDEKIMQVCFSDDDSSIYVSVIGEEKGELRIRVLCFSLTANVEKETWQTYIGSEITYSLEHCDDGIYAVTGGGNIVLDKNTGEILAQGYFSKAVSDIPPCDGLRVVMFHDTVSNGEILTVYGSDLAPLHSVSPESVTAVDVCNGKMYILSDNMLYQYNSSLELTQEYELDNSYSDLRVIDNSAILLGYNSVQKQALKG